MFTLSPVFLSLSSLLRPCHQMGRPSLLELGMRHYVSGTSSVRHAAPRYVIFYQWQCHMSILYSSGAFVVILKVLKDSTTLWPIWMVLTPYLFSFSFLGIKVSAEPLHENTIVNSPGLDWFQEEPAELWLKCTEPPTSLTDYIRLISAPLSAPTTTTTVLLKSTFSTEDEAETSNNCHPSQWYHWLKNKQSIVRTRCLLKKMSCFLFCCGSDEIVLLYIIRSRHVQEF